ncbi:hypothetical protein GCM10011502_19590 [Oceanisphaera marina]|uniref:Surface antigen domain-containing protein n=2 Tax=Oceanisphaera marina TaxID=2017550 RepID=A0ABQ1ILC3_9GAMM|nr:hypothetical protein GCM10011502_19590 [Oceanisphaera marina]
MAASGCANQQQNNLGSQPAIDNVALTQYLNTSTATATVLATSPWGPNVQVMAEQAYFAASGRTCRQLQVSQPNGNTQQHIACQLKNGSWTISRDLQQRPFGEL